MTPAEFWWLVEDKLDQVVYGNGMTHREVREIYEEAYGGDA